MKFLALLLILFPVFSHADMAGVDFNFGQGTRPSYSIDYERNKDGQLPYMDFAFSANKDYWQDYTSAGLQFEHINVGAAIAFTMSDYANGAFHTQIIFGPEVGYMYNLTKLIYVKENNNYMGFNGRYYFGSTLSVGLNF